MPVVAPVAALPEADDAANVQLDMWSLLLGEVRDRPFDGQVLVEPKRSVDDHRAAAASVVDTKALQSCVSVGIGDPGRFRSSAVGGGDGLRWGQQRMVDKLVESRDLFVVCSAGRRC
ncbi:hypothetical protein [Dactylosporangium sp. NPDC048998]|uniref:hypothetical protein n=1 Tax=Dactylosporangium sp. NPDC048998 TaxID=3363976 RepID=UPI00371F4527